MPTNNTSTLPIDRDLSVSRLMITLAVIGGFIIAGGVVGAMLLALEPSATWTPLVGSVTKFITVDGEANLWAWYSTILLATLALLLAMSTVVLRTAGRRYGVFVLLSGVAAFMSLDESVSLHEKLRRLIPDSTSGYQWLLVGVPAAIVVGVVVLLASRGMGRLLRRRLIVAGVVFLSGAVVTEAVQGIVLALLGVVSDHTNPFFAVGSSIEEGLELAGTLLAIRAILMGLRIRVGSTGLVISAPEAAETPASDRIGSGADLIGGGPAH